MPFFYSDDPVRDAARYDAYQAAQMEQLPECTYCEKKIEEDTLIDFGDELICEGCLDKHFRKRVEDYIE